MEQAPGLYCPKCRKITLWKPGSPRPEETVCVGCHGDGVNRQVERIWVDVQWSPRRR